MSERAARPTGQAPRRRQDFYVFTAYELRERDRERYGELLARCVELELQLKRLRSRLGSQRAQTKFWRNRCGVKNKRGDGA